MCNVNPESCNRACKGQAYIPLLIVVDTSYKYMTDPVVNSYHASHKPVVFTTQGVHNGEANQIKHIHQLPQHYNNTLDWYERDCKPVFLLECSKAVLGFIQ